ncbi:hypothetical protein HHI36_000539 [Cryptolaemus montrouzieri]|uniref:Uncharacterized protein n=1 Tax=Cryptolaemus montrouzieri TaxID=559131 RepID=A0ABD2P5C6_9CUCU
MIQSTQEITDEERQCKPKRYKFDRLQDPSVAFLYKLRLSQKLTQIDDSTPTTLYDGFVESIHQASEESLGGLDNYRGEKRAYNNWLTTKDLEDRKYYMRIRREVKGKIIKRKNEFWDAKCEEVDQYLGSSRSRKSWRLLKNLRTN